MLLQQLTRTANKTWATGFFLTGLTATMATSLYPAAAGADPLRLEAEMGEVKLRLSGRFMHDTLLTSSLDSRYETRHDWRRARLGVRANFSDDWRFRASADFPDGDADLRDLRFDYRGWPLHLSMGRMQEPFGMSENGSSNHLPMMERPLASGLGPSYGTGIKTSLRGRTWGLSTGLFGPDLFGLRLADSDSDNDRAINVRGTWRAFRSKETLLHVGASLSGRNPADDRTRTNTLMETTLVSRPRVSHPRIGDVDRKRLTGLEMGLRRGPALVQAEYIRSDIERYTTGRATFDGYYVQASWALTGERRRYSVRNGVFGGIDPKRPLTAITPDIWKTGAWEVAAGYSYLNLRDADVDLDGDIDGERGETMSLGLNWYPNANTRLMFNVLHVEEEKSSSTDSETILQMRAQVFF